MKGIPNDVGNPPKDSCSSKLKITGSRIDVKLFDALTLEYL
jgi:hypothetical protein